MLIVGIVGGIASGKSVVAACFEDLGAVVLDADRAGHHVLTHDDVRDQIRNIWGNSVFQENGQVDRKQLGKIVFALQGGENELAKLEKITHPRIRKILNQQIRELQQSGVHPVAILDAPILFKTGWDEFCDLIVFVESSVENRIARAKNRGWSKADLERRESSQVPLDIKRSKSDCTVDNNGSIESVKQQVSQIWNRLLAGD